MTEKTRRQDKVNEPNLCRRRRTFHLFHGREHPEDEGYQAIVFPDAESFWEKLATMEPSLVLLDVWLPGMDGMQLLKRLHDRFPLLPVIMMSGHAGIESAVAAIKAGAYDFLESRCIWRSCSTRWSPP